MAPVLIKYLSAVQRRVLEVSLALAVASTVMAQCKPADLRAYSVCFPEKWRVDKDPATAKVSACNKATGPCAGNGAVAVTITTFQSAEKSGDLAKAIGQLEATNHPSGAEPAEYESGTLAGQTEYVLSRSLVSGKTWHDLYVIKIGPKMFSAVVQYNDEPATIDANRSTLFRILASISVVKTANP